MSQIITLHGRRYVATSKGLQPLSYQSNTGGSGPVAVVSGPPTVDTAKMETALEKKEARDATKEGDDIQVELGRILKKLRGH